MFTSGDFEIINEELETRLEHQGKKIRKMWLTMLLIVSFICAVLVLSLSNQFWTGDDAWVVTGIGAFVFMVCLVGYLVSRSYRSEKPYFEYLYNEVIDKINSNEGLFVSYKAYDKDQGKEFNKSGGLFTRYASVNTRRSLQGKSDSDTPFEIYDCLMTTSDGKTQSVHFDGVYFVLRKSMNTRLQVRTTGSPKLKGGKFERAKEIEDIRVFKPYEHSLSNIDYTFINYIKKLKEHENYKHVYLSITEDSIHLGINYKKHPLRKPSSFDLTVLNTMITSFLEELKVLNEVDKIDHFDY